MLRICTLHWLCVDNLFETPCINVQYTLHAPDIESYQHGSGLFNDTYYTDIIMMLYIFFILLYVNNKST